MKKTLAILAAAAMTVSLAACGVGTDSDAIATTAGSSVSIGVYEPQTPAGIRESLAITYANIRRPAVVINGVSHQIRLHRQDSRSGRAAEKLVRKGCVAIIGSCAPEECFSAAPVFAEAKIPAVSSCSNENITLRNDYFFMARSPAAFQGTLLANWAVDNGYRQVSVVNSVDDSYSLQLTKAFTARLTARGGQVRLMLPLPADPAGYGSLLTRIRNSGSKAVFAPVSPVQGARLLKQAAAQNLQVQWMSGDHWITPSLLSESAVPAEGAVLTCGYTEGGNENFDRAFRAWLESDPQRLKDNGGTAKVYAGQAMTYDSYNAVLDAMEAAGTTEGATIRDTLSNLQVKHSVTSLQGFDIHGNARRSSGCMLRVRNGKFSFAGTIALKKLNP